MASTMDEAGELVSVVIPTLNAAGTIETCLASIRAQTHPEIELIVVDNWSQDGTWEAATDLADVAVRAGPERAAQRNIGIQRAGGDWVLWIDADMELAPEVVERSLAAAHAGGAAGVFIPEVTVGSGFWTACRTLERRCYHGEPLIEAPRLLRTGQLRALGGFSERLAGTEDAALRTRLRAEGTPLVWADTLILHHEGRLTLGGVARKRFYYGRSIPAYRHAHPGAVSGQASATLAALWRHRRLLAADPPHAAGVLLLRAWEAAAYLAGATAAALAKPRPAS